MFHYKPKECEHLSLVFLVLIVFEIMSNCKVVLIPEKAFKFFTLCFDKQKKVEILVSSKCLEKM